RFSRDWSSDVCSSDLPERNVLNDIDMDRGRFCIVTGANMAGKSTFLRSVALLLVMANTGMPVKGRGVRYSPLRLLTSMRSSDSLDRKSVVEGKSGHLR